MSPDIEMSDIGENAHDTKNITVDTNKEALKPSSVSVLFLKYSTKMQKFMMILVSIVAGIIQPLSYIYMGTFIDVINTDPVDYDVIGSVLLKFAGFLFLSAFLAFLERLFLGYFSERVTRTFRKKYVKSLLKHDVEYIESSSPGRLGQRFSEESSRIVDGLGPDLGLFIRSFSSFICGIVIGFYYSWQITIYIFIIFPFVVYFGSRCDICMSKWTEITTKEHQTADVIAEETFRNVKTVTALGAESKFEKKYGVILEDCKSRAIVQMKEAGFSMGAMSMSIQLASSLLLIVGIIIVYSQRKHYPDLLIRNNCDPAGVNSVAQCFEDPFNVTFGYLFNYPSNSTCQEICTEIINCWLVSGGRCLVGGDVLIMSSAVMSSVMGISNSFSSIQALAKSRMSAAYFIDVIEHADDLDAAGKTGTEPQSNGGDIEFKDVHFRYKGRDAMILNGLNLSIREGEMIGLVGESGCGKSTVLKLLMRLYAPSSGHIEWNGADVSDLSIPWIRDQISYVSQEPVLFSGTIRENIMYGRVGCTETEMIAAAKLVEADAFIRTFPKGYDTFVGELGTSLSGGQKQRIAIARAFLRKPRILVFDEATSALDTQSERIVQRAIDSIRSTSTANGGHLSIVVVAHRLSSIRSCDRIVVIDEGRVAEEGTHESLLSKGGIYSGLYQSQENVSTPTPTLTEESGVLIHTTSLGFESMKSLSDGNENKGNSCTNDNDNEICDEIPLSQMKKISLFQILSHAKGVVWMLYTGCIGSFLEVFFPPSTAYCATTAQTLFFSFDFTDYWRKSWICIIIIITAAFFSLIGEYIQWTSHGILGETLVANVRAESYKKYLSMTASFFDDERHLPSVLTARLSIDARRLRDLVDRIAPIVENIILVVVCLVLSFSSLGYWKLAIVAVCMSPFLICVEYLVNTVIFKITDKIDSNLTKKSGELTDYLLNIHTIHAYNLSERLNTKINKELIATDRLTISRMWRSAVGQGVSLFMPTVYLVVIFSVGAVMINKGEIGFSQMYFVMMTINMCAQFIGMNMADIPEIKLAQKSANNVMALLDTLSEAENDRAVVTTGRDGDIVFNHVSFAYPTRPEVKILSDISFTIPAGSSVAFVGPSGCGKSTIISLIQRMYHCDSGSISLDGTDINSLNLDWYRAQLGAVNQEPCLFSGTIRDNVLMGVNGDVSTEVIKEACRQALCLDFINEMPDRFETDLGATGKAVSGGQKQRLALARAILREPRVLLLDEATSALDSENQDKFLQALKIWRENHKCTVVTVAHRLSTIVDSDVIFVVNNGYIVGKGTHDELINSCSFYADLIYGQMNSSPHN